MAYVYEIATLEIVNDQMQCFPQYFFILRLNQNLTWIEIAELDTIARRRKFWRIEKF